MKQKDTMSPPLLQTKYGSPLLKQINKSVVFQVIHSLSESIALLQNRTKKVMFVCLPVIIFQISASGTIRKIQRINVRHSKIHIRESSNLLGDKAFKYFSINVSPAILPLTNSTFNSNFKYCNLSQFRKFEEFTRILEHCIIALSQNLSDEH